MKKDNEDGSEGRVEECKNQCDQCEFLANDAGNNNVFLYSARAVLNYFVSYYVMRSDLRSKSESTHDSADTDTLILICSGLGTLVKSETPDSTTSVGVLISPPLSRNHRIMHD
jgi:hypothetical protein